MDVSEIERIRAEFLRTPKGSYGVRGYGPEIVEAIFNDYMEHDQNLAEVARRWNRASGSLASVLARWDLREKLPARSEQAKQRSRDLWARFAADRHATAEELEAIIARMVAHPRRGKGSASIYVPRELKWEFRSWPMEKRAWFINTLRTRLNSPKDRPPTPFSSNVTPFDYTTPAAREIAARINAGRDSRHAVCKIDLASQGVIYKGELFFWAAKTGYQRRGHWKRGEGRPLLHRIVWKEHHGRPLPPKHIVYFRDGNRNNFDPENLGLMSMNENARRNQAAALMRKSREQTALLLGRAQQKRNKHHGLIEALARAA